MRRTNKVALFCARGTGLSLSFGIHLLTGFTNQWQLTIITVGDALKEVLNAQKFHHSLRMIDVCVGEQPWLYFRGIQAFNEFPQLRVWLQDIVEGKSIINFIIELERINLVVARQAFDGQPVLFVIFLVKHMGILHTKIEMLDEKFV